MHLVHRCGICICVSVCLLINMSPAKTAEPTKMLFRILSLVGPENQCISWG